MNLLHRKLNSLYYHYRRTRWKWHPRFQPNAAVQVDRPIFLLGTQGGGLTLASRILRRTPGVVSVTGNHRYWTGGDEMQDVLRGLLPPALSWRPEIATVHGQPVTRHTWLYACNELLPLYRGRREDATDALRAALVQTIASVQALNSAPMFPARLVDKSQTFTVRVGLISQLLNFTRPRFVLITRNPLAVCWRAATKVDALINLPLKTEDKLALAIEHWKNSMNAALDDGSEVGMRWWRFEDLLEAPADVIAGICEYAELPFSESMLPAKGDAIPFGSAYDALDSSKWYPLRPDVNLRYLRAVPDWARSRIIDACEPLMARFGYCG